ncbi:MAG: hypothetical protein US66_C0013G0019 [Candidatus Moranbacteria bacterium GW2011_GWD2_37_9]|nr:MAG: hypothetical protein US66_C0013G0019 [Candidatus Moranbacteria bacterium GW2011_GWD2_37_9]
MAKKNILDKLAEEVDKIKTTVKSKTIKTEKKTTSKKEEKATKKSVPEKISSTEQEEDSSPMGKLLSENPIEIPELGDTLEGNVQSCSFRFGSNRNRNRSGKRIPRRNGAF